MHLKLLEQSTSEKNLSLKTQVAKLEANIEKLCYQLRRKNVQGHNLWKICWHRRKRYRQVLEKNKCLKLKNKLLKSKTSKTSGKDQFKLDNKKLKGMIKSMKVLHKDQICMKDVRINELNSTIKTLKSKVTALEKSLANVDTKFTIFNANQLYGYCQIGA